MGDVHDLDDGDLGGGDGLDGDDLDGGDENRAPICPACGVTALAGDPAYVVDTRFVCENPDCDAFGEEV